MLSRPPKVRWRLLAAALSSLFLGACGVEARHDPFTASGELIALSGGDGGVRNACFTCHGVRGQGDHASVPRLAGLPAGHLQKQLEDYAAGRRDDPVMGPVAWALTTDDRRAVAAYYGGLPASVGEVGARGGSTAAAARLYHLGDLARGIAPCATCHGAVGEGVGAANPPVARQPQAYLADQLARWRAGRRRNDPRGVMMQISQRLTASEIAALAAYAATLSGLPVPAELSPEASRSARRGDAARGAERSPPHAVE